jgi:hypothetical protein
VPLGRINKSLIDQGPFNLECILHLLYAVGHRTLAAPNPELTTDPHMSLFKATFAAAALALCATTHAGVITIGGAEVTNPDHIVNFDSGFAQSRVTNQFVAQGLTITTLSGNGIAAINNIQCNNSSSGVSGIYLYMGVIAPCSHSSTMLDSASIRFNTDVDLLSWTGFNRANLNGFTIQALNDGDVVSSIVFNLATRFENRVVTFSGATFDELRFTENAGGDFFFALDNLKWNEAAATVAEPGALGLLGLSLAAAGLMARRRKTA